MGSRLINNGQCIMTIRAVATVIPDSLQHHMHDRLSRLARMGWAFAHASVEVRHEKNPRLADNAFTAQITCRNADIVVRAEAAGATAGVAFDMCIDRLHSRLRRLADKETSRRRGRFGHNHAVVNVPLELMDRATATGFSPEAHDHGQTAAPPTPLIVRTKAHPWRSMTTAEAVDAMELLGHSFYLFVDRDTGEPAVVYQRKAYTYGVVKLGEEVEQRERDSAAASEVCESRNESKGKRTLSAKV